ncbi:MAG: hypothetical protein GEU82_17750 [Luteitalea sp.]|nr:hypothetical protein [Luteitalea sp.]
MSRRRSRVCGIVTAVALAAGLAAVAGAQTNEVGQRFSAVAIDLDRGNATPIQIVIERWSSKAQRQRLTDVMLNKGPEKLLEALRDAPKVGYIRTNTSLGWDLHYASHVRGEDGGERIIVATDRPMSFAELWHRPRSIDYPFTFIELHVNDAGEGDGTLSLATKVIPDKTNNIVTLENYDTQRIRLQQVKRESAN